MLYEVITGEYISETAFSGAINRTYSLNIWYNNIEYQAVAGMLPVTVSNPLPYAQAPDSNLYYIASDITVFNPDESFMAEVLLDWSKVPGFDTLPLTKTSALLYFYRLTTVDVNEIFSPASEPVYFPAGTYMT